MLGGNLDIASHCMPANFISRTPNVAEGREAFVQALRTRPQLFQNTARGQSRPKSSLQRTSASF